MNSGRVDWLRWQASNTIFHVAGSCVSVLLDGPFTESNVYYSAQLEVSNYGNARKLIYVLLSD
jgi:hypothetical protein